ncbi:hypothetical protein HK098_002009 [Nowakowskiella sp. JEL0407]|nr:hypothetical protein HK098_002009 [Nowakowskiella sp. JEL0407]
MFLLRKFLVFASLFKLAYSACSDLGRYLTFSNRMCFDTSITCSQYYTTISGSFCSGGTFTTPLADFRCNSVINHATITTSSCIIEVGSNICFSNTATYSTATVSGVYLVGPVSSPCYSPLSQAQTQYEVIVFATGTVNGVVAGIPSSVPSPSPLFKSPSPSSGSSSSSAGSTSTKPADNTVIIIIAVIAGVVLIIAGVVAFLIIKKMKANKQPPQDSQQAQPFMHAYSAVPVDSQYSQYPPSSPYSDKTNSTFFNPYGQPSQPPYGQPGQTPYGQPSQPPFGQPYGQPSHQPQYMPPPTAPPNPPPESNQFIPHPPVKY